jgi:TonB-linked SusC/RagA family outer membrane protein
MKKYLLTIYLLLLCGFLWAQQQTVTGTVRDKNETLVGVSIIEKDMPSNGTLTDENGKFRITLKGSSKVLMVKYIGYLSKEINVAGQSVVSVTLDVDAKGLEEVVVVAYGTQKKVTNTGSISAISGDDIRQTPAASLQNTLIGRVPGITTQQRSGQPGADGAVLLIRGLSTTNGNGAPLVIVDDLEYFGNIAEIDPDQIETFTILKDAATTAVYGIKGANGVVVITTKRGRSGKSQITVRTENSIQTPTYMPEYLDSYRAAVLVNQALLNDGQPARFSQNDLDLFQNGSDPYGHPNVNWTDELLRKYSVQSRNNINIQGGIEKAKYYVSAGYLFQNGLIKDFSGPSGMNSNYYYKRYNFRSNLDLQPTKTLALSLDLSGTFAERNSPTNGGRNNRNNIFFELSDANQLPPYAYPIYNPDGSYGVNSAILNNNVVGRLTYYGYNRQFTNDITANFRATQNLSFLTKGLSAKGVVGFNGQYGFNRNLTRGTANDFPSYYYNPTANTYTISNTNFYRIGLPSLSYSNSDSFKRLNWQGSVNYDRTFASHHVYGLALYSTQNNVRNADEPSGFRGFTFRAGYDFKQRYIIELNAGYNGSSAFVSDKRYSWFPAISLGWNVAEESFFKNNIKFIDLFKIRGSFGKTGSDDIGNFAYTYLSTYVNGGSYSIGDNHNAITGIREGLLAQNPTWETEEQANIGVDINMFKGKFKIVADLFDRYRYNILTSRTLSNIAGITPSQLPPSNINRVSNRGFEAQLTYIGNINQLSFNVSGNISVSKNKILFMDEATPPFPYQQLTDRALGSILGYNFLGYYTQEEIDNPAVAKPTVGTTRAGDLKYADTNGDGVVNVDDRIVLSLPNLPNTILGLTFGLNYKNFAFTVTAQSGLNFARRSTAEAIRPGLNNFREIHEQAWTPENSVNPAFPRLSLAGSNLNDPAAHPSNYWFRRSDYLRIKTLELSYSLPKNLVTRVGLQGARVYVNGYNLVTWDLKEKNIYNTDPENTSGNDGAGFYPQTKVYNLGLQISF